MTTMPSSTVHSNIFDHTATNSSLISCNSAIEHFLADLHSLAHSSDSEKVVNEVDDSKNDETFSLLEKILSFDDWDRYYATTTIASEPRAKSQFALTFLISLIDIIFTHYGLHLDTNNTGNRDESNKYVIDIVRMLDLILHYFQQRVDSVCRIDGPSLNQAVSGEAMSDLLLIPTVITRLLNSGQPNEISINFLLS